jgi:cytochrome c oxidase subunit III
VLPATVTVPPERDLNSLSMLTAGVVLATVTMTFGAIIAVFVIRSQAAVFWGHISIPRILWATTAILLASSVTFELGRKHLMANRQTSGFQLLTYTTGLGFGFLAGQILAWVQVLRSGVVLARNPHSWFLFLFTGLHGLHIVLGLSGLVYLLTRTYEPASGPKYQLKTRVVANGVALFWHYLDFVWIVLFGLLVAWKR